MALDKILGIEWRKKLQDALDTLEGKTGAASATASGIVELATDAEAVEGTDTERAITPANLAAAATTHVDAATATAAGKVELATTAEVVQGSDTERAVTPAGVKAPLDARIVAGTYTADTDDDTAGSLTIDTGFAAATVFIVQIYRSGVPIFSDQAVSMASGVITVADGGATYAITDGDVINWMVG